MSEIPYSLTCIRRELGCNQRDFALYLSVTRSALSMLEIDKRRTDVAMIRRLDALRDQLGTPLPENTDATLTRAQQSLKDDSKGSIKFIIDRIRVLEYILIKRRTEFSLMEANYPRIVRALELLDRLTTNPFNQDSQTSLGMLNAMRAKRRRELQKNGLEAQIKLRCQIVAIEAELEELKGYQLQD